MLKESRKILQYQALRKISAGENFDPLVVLDKFCPEIICRYQKKDMFKYGGKDILVRKKLAEKLCRAQNNLQCLSPGARLKVVYGYRHPLVQKRYFDRLLKIVSSKNRNLKGVRLIALAHNFVASPDVAGHITGGAIDVTIECRGRELDMGTKIADFSKPEKIKTNSLKITRRQTDNRKLLHDLLVEQGLAPFYGEWWHFSYGDKEWACFYKKKKSLYSEISYSA